MLKCFRSAMKSSNIVFAFFKRYSESAVCFKREKYSDNLFILIRVYILVVFCGQMFTFRILRYCMIEMIIYDTQLLADDGLMLRCDF